MCLCPVEPFSSPCSLMRVIRDSYMAEAKAKAKEKYASNMPFRYVVLQNACVEERLEQSFRAAIQGLEADLKDSDTFKRYEGPPLQLLDGTPGLGPLIALRDSLYSAEFRALVSDVTGRSP